MSCFCVIATVIVASVALPACASLSVIRPSKLTPTIVNNGDGIYSYTYRLPTAPLWKIFVDGQLVEQHQSDFQFYASEYDVHSGNPLYRIRLFATGTEPSTSKANCPVLELSDFKTNSVLSFRFNVAINLHCTSGGSSELTWTTLSAPEIYWYDSDYSFITKWTGANVGREVDATTPISLWVLQNSYNITIPDNAVYCVPAATIRLYDPIAGSLVSISSNQAEYFDFTVTKDSVIENSDTMKAMDQKLDELIEQNETIISGSDQLQQDAQTAIDKVQEDQEEFDSIMEQLEDYEKVDTSTAMDAIKDFLAESGWHDVRELLSPLLDWGPTATIMLLVLAFANLSIIFFGR